MFSRPGDLVQVNPFSTVPADSDSLTTGKSCIVCLQGNRSENTTGIISRVWKLFRICPSCYTDFLHFRRAGLLECSNQTRPKSREKLEFADRECRCRGLGRQRVEWARELEEPFRAWEQRR